MSADLMSARNRDKGQGGSKKQTANQMKRSGSEGDQVTQTSDQALSDTIAALERAALTGMSRFLTLGAQGQLQLDMENCSPEDMDRLAEIQLCVHKMPGEKQVVIVSFKLKMKDRLKSLDELASHLGLGRKDAKLKRRSDVAARDAQI